MDPRDQETLRVNHVYLVDNLDLNHQRLQAHLFQENLLSDNDLDRLKASRFLAHDSIQHICLVCYMLSPVRLSVTLVD